MMNGLEDRRNHPCSGKLFAAILCAGSLAIVGGAPLSAQGTASASADRIAEIKVTGCLERSQGTSDATTNDTASASNAAGAKFILAAAKAVQSDSSTEVSAVEIAPTYRLDGRESDFTAHVGRTVEIAGTVERILPPPATGYHAGAAPELPKLEVITITTPAASCSK